MHSINERLSSNPDWLAQFDNYILNWNFDANLVIIKKETELYDDGTEKKAENREEEKKKLVANE
jgi:hypothetical protein